MKANKSHKTDLNGIDAQLAAMLPDYTVDNWETRKSSKGTAVLYIRCRALVPPTQLRVA